LLATALRLLHNQYMKYGISQSLYSWSRSLLIGFGALTVATSGCSSSLVRQSVSYYESGDLKNSQRAADQAIVHDQSDQQAWRMKLRAQLALGDEAAMLTTYTQYLAHRDGHDTELMRELALVTIGQGLRSQDPDVKIASIAAVEEAEIESLAEQLGNAINDEDPRVAVTAAVAVINSHPFAAKVAQDSLKSGNAAARRIAVNGIGKKVGVDAIVDIEAVAEDRDAGVRRAAVRWLGQFGNPAALRTVLKRLQDSDDGVRGAAAKAVIKLAAKLPASEQQTDSLNLAKLAKSLLAIDGMATKLGALEMASFVKDYALLRATAQTSDATVALDAAIALPAPKSTEDQALLVAAFQRAKTDEKYAVRAGAVNVASSALSELDAAKLYVELTSDPHPTVRLAAARALIHLANTRPTMSVDGAIPAEVAKKLLLSMLETSSTFDDRLAAATELASMNDSQGIEQLVAMATANTKLRNSAERAAAVYAHVSARVMTPALIAALADSSSAVRVEAARAILARVK
jgi:HEAT repeat protein